MPDAERRDALESALAAVRGQIADAAKAADRDPASITLVVVTKTWPVSDIRLLNELGVRDFGENRHQEAESKALDLGDLDLVWHFVGQVQSNKAARIGQYCDVVHSVDSGRIARRLDTGAHKAGRRVDCLIQVNLDADGASNARGGLEPAEVDDVAHAIATAGALRLAGVMGVAPLGADPGPSYQRLTKLARELSATYPGADVISAGMSADFQDAIAAGATHVRIGSAVLGQRPPLG